MTSLAELEEKFKPVFSKEQSNVLAETFVTSYSESVKSKDFDELKYAVAEIRESQIQLGIKINELAVNVNVLASRMDSIESRMDSIESRMDSIESRMDSIESRIGSLESRIGSMETYLKILGKQVGGLSESFGGSLEDFSLEVVPELLEKHWKMQIESTAVREEIDVNGKPTEFDLVIQGTADGKKLLVLGEVKSNVTADEVRRFFRTVNKIKKDVTDTELRMIFFGYRVKQEAKHLIRDHGAYMFFTNGRILQH